MDRYMRDDDNNVFKENIRELLIDENNPNHFFDIDRMKEKSIISYIAPVIVIALGIYLIVA